MNIKRELDKTIEKRGGTPPAYGGIAKSVRVLGEQPVGVSSWNDLEGRPFYDESKILYDDHPDVAWNQAKLPGVVLREGVTYKAARISGSTATSRNYLCEHDGTRLGIKKEDSDDGFEIYMGDDGYCYFSPIGTLWQEALGEIDEDNGYAYTTKYGLRLSYVNNDDVGVVHLPERFMPLISSPNGTQYEITVSDDGILSAVAVTA